MGIIEMMYENNEVIHNPIQCTEEEECLSRTLEDYLSDEGIIIFEKLQNVQYANVKENAKEVYSEGFKDALRVLEELNI